MFPVTKKISFCFFYNTQITFYKNLIYIAEYFGVKLDSIKAYH